MAGTSATILEPIVQALEQGLKIDRTVLIKGARRLACQIKILKHFNTDKFSEGSRATFRAGNLHSGRLPDDVSANPL